MICWWWSHCACVHRFKNRGYVKLSTAVSDLVQCAVALILFQYILCSTVLSSFMFKLSRWRSPAVCLCGHVVATDSEVSILVELSTGLPRNKWGPRPGVPDYSGTGTIVTGAIFIPRHAMRSGCSIPRHLLPKHKQLKSCSSHYIVSLFTFTNIRDFLL